MCTAIVAGGVSVWRGHREAEGVGITLRGAIVNMVTLPPGTERARQKSYSSSVKVVAGGPKLPTVCDFGAGVDPTRVAGVELEFDEVMTPL
jgi:hypothetical protein